MVGKPKKGGMKSGKTTAAKARKKTPAKAPARQPSVIVYTAEWCPWCHRAMDFLKSRNIAFNARDVDNPLFAQEAMERSGQSGIPVIIVGEEVIVGFDEIRLKALLNLK